ncbi:hypothetical protein B1C78_03185 [Thioalkalivibrio denitrificans]|uniref:Uncharacterized protein n=1 Tax=Thioalkalivibrio denitrificans TaxID=108003 RepID=A0A1V3NS21_9GAMM|nr:hypothetical protein [Thioalkalivibrio denitrificans]OOG27668.1 hypothetical protein B1C78_03185 [Thioalkalivibrio denitrificans]
MTDDPKIPSDHPIRKVWEANEKLRSIPGLIELAERGDHYAAKQLLAWFCNDVSRRRASLITVISEAEPPPRTELMEYLAACFTKILQGDDPAAALNLSGGTGSGKRGRPKLTASDHQRLARVGMMVARKIDEYGRGGFKRALSEVAEEAHCSEGTADRAYQMYMKGTVK